jgi:hypothetical protein
MLFSSEDSDIFALIYASFAFITIVCGHIEIIMLLVYLISYCLFAFLYCCFCFESIV